MNKKIDELMKNASVGDFDPPIHEDLGDDYQMVSFYPKRAYIMKQGKIVDTCHVNDVERVLKERMAEDLESYITILLDAGYTATEAQAIIRKIKGEIK